MNNSPRLIGLVFALAILITLLIGAVVVRDWLDPLARERQMQLADATPAWIDVAIVAAWRILLYVAAPATAIAIAWRRWGSRETLRHHYEAQITAAQHQIFPNVTTYSPHQARNHDLAAPAPSSVVEGQIVPEGKPALTLSPARPGLPLLAQLHAANYVCRSGRSLMVGQAAGQAAYIELAECGFIAVAGQPRVGKSTEVVFLLAQAALAGWHIAIADPHIHKDDGLINRCRPMSGRAIRQAVTPEEVAALIRYIDKIGRARVNGDRDRTPVLLVIDEFSNFVIRGLLPDDVLAALPAMAMEYAGVGVHGIIIGHDWSKNLLGGDLGAALRRTITHRIVCRSDPQNAEFLLPSSALARQASGLQKGQALFWGPESPVVVDTPNLLDEDVRYAAQSTPERPYAPWTPAQIQAASSPRAPSSAVAAGLPRTAPIAAPLRAAPPTAPISPLTIEEQIVNLLAVRSSWLLSSEIVDVLRTDQRSTLSRLTDLSRRGAIRQRPSARGGREKWEYAALVCA